MYEQLSRFTYFLPTLNLSFLQISSLLVQPIRQKNSIIRIKNQKNVDVSYSTCLSHLLLQLKQVYVLRNRYRYPKVFVKKCNSQISFLRSINLSNLLAIIDQVELDQKSFTCIYLFFQEEEKVTIFLLFFLTLEKKDCRS